MPYPETIKYIKKQLENGISEDRIRKALTDSGYQQEVIDQLMNDVGAPKPEKKSSGIENILKDAAIGTVLLLIIGSFVYFNFFNKDTEFFSPQATNTIKVDFSRISPIELTKDGSLSINLNDYVKDRSYKPAQLVWGYNGKLCINIQISNNQAMLKSIFLPDCPLEENIIFEANNPDGESGLGMLTVRIV